ncbi:hypothetical protein [uncultured Campylobacter sp.]|uniref:hypothetical protein n=1 Tax=uncultured Campylobacter sp. TaxID=218934 RepID=UPI00262F04B2|nr:hypothetical protein [uncultured Campylobacter sp.]
MKFRRPQRRDTPALPLNLRTAGFDTTYAARNFMLNLRAAQHPLLLKILKFNSVCAHYALFLPQRKIF